MAETPLDILMVASEAGPYAKTGGLADVMGSLPAVLRKLGHDVRLVMPWYRSVQRVTGPLQPSRTKINVPMGGRIVPTAWRSCESSGVPVYFADYPEFYDRDGFYGEHGEDYPDNAERFGLLSRFALELARFLGFSPQIVHAHDWQTGLVPVFLQHHLWRDPFFSSTASLFSIHNLGYQGLFPLSAARSLGLEEVLLTPEGLEFYGQLSMLKGGIRYADQVSTVSPTYCKEILTPQQGMGLDGLLRSRADHLHGLLNGLDEKLWSPSSDAAIPSPYSTLDLSGKSHCKARLQQEVGLTPSADIPVLAMVTRLDPQKGIELVLENWHKILRKGVQVVILGTGHADLEQRLKEVARFYPGFASVTLTFNDALSRRIYAGSDLFLMPSRYEPCGLGQLIALRYGAVPLVHATGGLADTIKDPRETGPRANGFTFPDYSANSFLSCLDRALATYADSRAWHQIMHNGMSQDLSWTQAAKNYEALYRRCKRTRQ